MVSQKLLHGIRQYPYSVLRCSFSCVPLRVSSRVAPRTTLGQTQENVESHRGETWVYAQTSAVESNTILVTSRVTVRGAVFHILKVPRRSVSYSHEQQSALPELSDFDPQVVHVLTGNETQMASHLLIKVTLQHQGCTLHALSLYRHHVGGEPS